MDTINFKVLKNLYITEYTNIDIYLEKFSIGALGYIHDKEKNLVHRAKLIHCITRSDNIDKYDTMTITDILNDIDFKFSYSGEFITDKDNYYAFLEVSEE